MNDTDNQPLEVMQPSAMMSIERAQIDSQVATAKQYPRNLADFKKRAVAMATLDAETAESCIYCRPVGKGSDGRQKMAEGASIRMAEIVATCYGNIRVGARIVEQTPRYVKCEGAAHDLETNFAAKAEVVESTVDRNGQPYSERQAALMAKVAVSKAFRDSTFRVVPRALMKPVLEECRKVIAKQAPTIAERLKRIQAWIGTLKIDNKRVFAVLNVNDWSQFTEDHFETLTGLKTAIQDGDAIDEIFPPLEGAGQANAPAATAHQQSQQAQQTPANVTPLPKTPEGMKAAEQSAKPRGRPPGSKNAAPAETAAKTEAPPEQPAGTPAAEAADPELAAMGLAPEQPTEKPAAATEQVGAGQGVSKPEFLANPNETPELNEVRRLMYDDEVTEETFMKFALAKKLAQSGQKLADLNTGKHTIFITKWTELLPKIKLYTANA